MFKFKKNDRVTTRWERPGLQTLRIVESIREEKTSDGLVMKLVTCYWGDPSRNNLITTEEHNLRFVDEKIKS